MTHPLRDFARCSLVFLFVAALGFAKGPKPEGPLMTWHPLSLTFDGPETGEAATPNPFTDYRLDVTFHHPDSGARVIVPGYYCADGDAADTSADAGNKWRVLFTPDRAGEWTYEVSFRTGGNVAVSDDPEAGAATAFDGTSGSLPISPSDEQSPDFRALGRVRYTGDHYLRHAQTGDFFIKGGIDSPENFLGYAEFDHTTAGKFGIHRYGAHVEDWKEGDPAWGDAKGRGIIGAVNYLSSQGVNSIYALTFNVAGGDGGDCFPWTEEDERLRFDCSKLDQWGVVLGHLSDRGIMAHLVTQETENDRNLGKDLTNERKLYYRELVARFSHGLALTWNLGEENNNTTEARQAFARFIRNLDPYDHLIVVHNKPKELEKTFHPLLAFEAMEGTSIQLGAMMRTFDTTLDLVQRSAKAGRKWVVLYDETFPNKIAKGDPNGNFRAQALWGNLMAGGGGVEWICDGLLKVENFRDYEEVYGWTRVAREFFARELPLQNMAAADRLLENPGTLDHCLADANSVRVIYLAEGGSQQIDLEQDGPWSVQWLDPRIGGPLQTGSIAEISGKGRQGIGQPPGDLTADWVVLLRNQSGVTSEPRPMESHGSRVEVDDNAHSQPFRMPPETPETSPLFIGKDGLVVMEMESCPPGEFWKLETAKKGFTGTGYYRYEGDDQSRETGAGLARGPLHYRFKVITPGIYRLVLRSMKNSSTGIWDQANDCYARILGLEGWHAKPTKTFTWGKVNAGWLWNTGSEITHGNHKTFQVQLEADQEYTFEIMGRSKNFLLDRIVFHHKDTVTENEATAETNPESETAK